MGRHVLVVDDEPALAEMTRDFLSLAGHDADVCTEAASAVRRITAQRYDVLISDLNISGPGDGYVLAGVSRIIQPEALVLLLTGLPDLENAWKSIQSSVDRVLLKSADPAILKQLVESLESPNRETEPRLDLGSLIAKYEDEIAAEWLEHVEADLMLGSIPMNSETRLDDLIPIMRVIEHQLHHPEDKITPERADAARKHGENRRTHGYPIIGVLREAGLLRQGIAEVMNRHFLELKPSHALHDLFVMDACIDENIAISLTAYLRER